MFNIIGNTTLQFDDNPMVICHNGPGEDEVVTRLHLVVLITSNRLKGVERTKHCVFT